MYKILSIFIFIVFTDSIYAGTNIDQWLDSKKSYKDLINEGFEVKSYDTTTIDIDGGLIMILFVTILQKNKEVFECHEYQTLDKEMVTLNMSLICKKLSQPYSRGVGT